MRGGKPNGWNVRQGQIGTPTPAPDRCRSSGCDDQLAVVMIFKVTIHIVVLLCKVDNCQKCQVGQWPVAENQFSKFATSLPSKHPRACMVDECQKRQAGQKQENYCTVLLDRHHNKEEILTGPNSMRCSCIISQSCQKGDRLMSDR